MISSREIDEGHHSIISFNQSAFVPLHAAKTIFYNQWRRENMKVFHNVAISQSDSQSCAFPLFTFAGLFSINWKFAQFFHKKLARVYIQLLLCCSRSQRVPGHIWVDSVSLCVLLMLPSIHKKKLIFMWHRLNSTSDCGIGMERVGNGCVSRVVLFLLEEGLNRLINRALICRASEMKGWEIAFLSW